MYVYGALAHHAECTSTHWKAHKKHHKECTHFLKLHYGLFCKLFVYIFHPLCGKPWWIAKAHKCYQIFQMHVVDTVVPMDRHPCSVQLEALIVTTQPTCPMWPLCLELHGCCLNNNTTNACQRTHHSQQKAMIRRWLSWSYDVDESLHHHHEWKRVCNVSGHNPYANDSHAHKLYIKLKHCSKSIATWFYIMNPWYRLERPHRPHTSAIPTIPEQGSAADNIGWCWNHSVCLADSQNSSKALDSGWTCWNELKTKKHMAAPHSVHAYYLNF